MFRRSSSRFVFFLNITLLIPNKVTIFTNVFQHVFHQIESPLTILQLKQLEQRRGEKLFEINFGNIFSYMIAKAEATKTKLDKCNFIKLKSSCKANY